MPTTFPTSIELSSLNGTNGFSIIGSPAGAQSGWHVSPAGDINADGKPDILIGASFTSPGGRTNAGACYVLFGGSGVGSSGSIDLANLNGTNGFVINGVTADDKAGYCVSDLGDVNGDGKADIIVGALQADPGGRTNAGASYVIFGATNIGSTGVLELSSLNGNNGFVINGVAASDSSGVSVSGAGDVNNDGMNDLIIGASGADPAGRVGAGATYVVFGATNIGSSGVIELSSLNGTNGFVINGITAADGSGFSVSRAGDFNNDGKADIIIGAVNRTPGARNLAGASYIVYGSNTIGNTGVVELSTLNGTNGCVLNGVLADDNSGYRVSNAGDINGDGKADVVIGAINADPAGRTTAGAAYVVFGASNLGVNGVFELSSLNGSNGFAIYGAIANDKLGGRLAFAGDVNGDGKSDVIVSAYAARNFGGTSYVIFGGNSVSGGVLEVSSLNGANGFGLNGVASGDVSGASVSTAGDINGDGLIDVVVGANAADPLSRNDAGMSYVIFGDIAPQLVNNTLTVVKGQASILTSSNLGATAGPLLDSKLLFLASAVTRGQFERISATGTAVTSFTQQEIKNGQIRFVHDGSNAAPSYSIVAKTSIGTAALASPQASTVNVIIPPTLLNNALSLNQGQILTLSNANLSASDDATPAANLVFTVTAVQHGQFELASVPNVAITSFAQSAITAGNIRFIHDGTNQAPAYMVSVNDGSISITPVSGAISFNAKPVIVNNQLSLNQGQTVTLSSSNLSATDDLTSAASISFSLTGIQHGQFENSIAPGVAIINFNQSLITNGNLRFVHDGSNQAPYYTLYASDGIANSSSVASTVNFNAKPVIVNNQLTLNKGQTVTLSNLNLSATDDMTPSSNIAFVISALQHGQFELASATGTAISSFTQSAITAGNVRFVHDGSNFAPSYSLLASDGAMNSLANNPSITFNRPPILITPITLSDRNVTVNQTFSFAIHENPTLLQFTDAEADNFSLEARFSNGSSLPTWLRFNSSSITMSGSVPSVQVLPLEISAVDVRGARSQPLPFNLRAQAPNTNSANESSGFPIAAIAGALGGLFALIALLGITFVWSKHRKKNTTTATSNNSQHELREYNNPIAISASSSSDYDDIIVVRSKQNITYEKPQDMLASSSTKTSDYDYVAVNNKASKHISMPKVPQTFLSAAEGSDLEVLIHYLKNTPKNIFFDEELPVPMYHNQTSSRIKQFGDAIVSWLKLEHQKPEDSRGNEFIKNVRPVRKKYLEVSTKVIEQITDLQKLIRMQEHQYEAPKQLVEDDQYSSLNHNQKIERQVLQLEALKSAFRDAPIEILSQRGIKHTSQVLSL